MQVTICKCDICGKEIHSPDGVVELCEWAQDGHFSDTRYELCGACNDKILPNIKDIIKLAENGVTVM